MHNPLTPDHSASPVAALASVATPSPSDAPAAAPADLPAPASPAAPVLPREVGGRDGPEPTRFGDWEKAGRCIDF
jgi:hypothetical protein